MNNAEHESPCLAELAAAAPLNRQRGLGTSGEPGRGALRGSQSLPTPNTSHSSPLPVCPQSPGGV